MKASSYRRVAGRVWIGAIVATGLLAAGIAAYAAPKPKKTVVYENPELVTVKGEGHRFDVKLEAFEKYVIEFQQGPVRKQCIWRIGSLEFGTAKTGRKWTKIVVPFEPEGGDTVVHFSVEALDSDKPCAPYKLKEIKIDLAKE